MTIKLGVDNLSDVIAGIQGKETEMQSAIQYALGMVALKVEDRAITNASGRPGPNVITGSLRASIAAQPVQRGFDNKYETSVSASMVYARAVELGHPNWPPGVKYPYLGPAARDLSSNGTLDAIFTSNLISRLRG